MVDSEDTWPLPKYNPGPAKHLHALGVIATIYTAFQRGMDELYKFHPRRQNVPDRLINLYYYGLNEEARISAVTEAFAEYEKEDAVKNSVENLAEYFKWCKNCRDQLQHSEHYPPSFVDADDDTLHLTMRVGKTSPRQEYIAFPLSRLRDIADKIQIGQIQCVRVRIYLRARGRPDRELPLSWRASLDNEHRSLPEKLRVPRYLKLSPIPPGTPLPEYLRRSSDP
jgi:hypothetical protein